MQARDDAVPLWMRLLAGGIDLALILIAAGVTGAATVKWTDWPRSERIRRGVLEMMTPLRVRVFGWAVRLAFLPARNQRGPGKALVGIRTVDARTGGPVTLRSAVISQVLQFAYERLIRRVNAPTIRRHERRVAETRRRVQEIQAAHADDPEAIQPAAFQAYRDTNVNCLAPLAIRLPASLLMPLTALLSPRRQTVADRLAGTVVVRDRARHR